MNPARTIQTTWFVMIFMQIIGTVDAQHRLPPPRAFVAISTLWGILFTMADTGLGKLASRLSLLALLTAAVIGPFGARFVKFLQMIASTFALPTAQAGTSPAAPTAPTAPPAPTQGA